MDMYVFIHSHIHIYSTYSNTYSFNNHLPVLGFYILTFHFNTLRLINSVTVILIKG